ncbi:MAG: hypothetical protein M1826_007213 [Phylliscum demangeonii]|nr:MAG: hypothetical protein M1826_007213 [Phylliscum demangeonii]
MAPYDQFIMFGDSITQGMYRPGGPAVGALLQDTYARRLDLINRGFSGYNTAHAVKALSKFMPTPDQAKIRFMQVTVEDFHRNLVKILTHPTVVAHQPRLILFTPPPVCEHILEKSDREKGFTTASRSAENTKRYVDAARAVGKELDIVVVDLWTAFMKNAGWKEGETLIGSKSRPASHVFRELLFDGLHLTSRGQQVVYDELIKTIRLHYPDQVAQALPTVLPGWRKAPV